MAFRDDEGNFYRPTTSTTSAPPPTAPAPAPAPTSGGGGGSGGGSGGGGGGVTYSYNYLPPQDFTNSPYLAQAKALADKQLAGLLSQLSAARSRALINLGDTGIASSLGFQPSPDAVSQVEHANKAGTSLLAQLQHSHDLTQQRIPAQLAGRGFFRSGETGYSLGQEVQRYGLQQSSARQQTLDYLNGLYSNYLNQKFGIEQGVQNATTQAYLAQMQQQPTLAGVSVSGLPTSPYTGATTPDASGPGYAPLTAPSVPDLKRQSGYGTSIPWTSGL